MLLAAVKVVRKYFLIVKVMKVGEWCLIIDLRYDKTVDRVVLFELLVF